MKLLHLLLGAGAVGLVWYATSQSKPTVEEMRAYLNSVEPHPSFQMMTEQELRDTYNFIVQYLNTGSKSLPPDLQARIHAISIKYNIFT